MTQGNWQQQPGEQPQGGQYGAPQGQYGQPAGYGQPGAAPARGGVGIVGLVVALIGAVAVVIAFTALKWADGSGHSKVSDIHKVLDAAPSSVVNGYANAYFAWLCWVLLVVTALVAIVANLPTGATPALRTVGLLLGLAAAAATVFSIKLATDGPSLGHNIKHAGPGYWTAIAGFVVIGIGAALGARRATAVRSY